MGDPLDPGEVPGRAVETAGFWMDRTEVTNAQFARFVQATGYVTEAERARQEQASRAGVVSVFRQPESVLGREDTSQWWAISREATWRQPSGRGSSVEGREAFPVVAVTYADASAYAQWLGRSLPSEIQWERAARLGATGGNTWQGLFPVLDAATDGHAGLAPVGCYTPNEMGVHDLIGNVWELTQDAYLGPGQLGAMIASTTSPGAMSRSGVGERKVSAHVIKGGSYLCSEDFCARARAGSRQPLEDGMAAVHVGFRTISGAPGPRSELGTGKSLVAVDQ
jgi:formylglycine-generating enzyme required for sulfatase activity